MAQTRWKIFSQYTINDTKKKTYCHKLKLYVNLQKKRIERKFSLFWIVQKKNYNKIELKKKI